MNFALNKKLFFHTSTPTPSMHRKLTEHGKLFCMQKNQQPNKNSGRIKDNSIVTCLCIITHIVTRLWSVPYLTASLVI
jgi:hypothetical protein